MASSDKTQHSTDRVPTGFDAWVDSFGAREAMRPLLRTVEVWANYCSPPNASDQSMTTACADLALWFFYLDDYERDDFELFFGDCERILGGSRPTTENQPILHAYADVVEQVGSYGHDIGYYLSSRRRSLDLIRQRIRFARSQSKRRLSFEEYYAQRMISVYVYQWLDMWEIIGGFYLDSQERALPALAEAKRAVTAWHILQNDARSLQRDMEAGSPNLVLLHAEQKSACAEETVAAMRQLFHAELENFQTAAQSILQSKPSDRLRRYVELLEICVTGGERSFAEIRERYNWDALPGLLAAARTVRRGALPPKEGA